MKFTIADGTKQAKIFVDQNEFPGVKRVARKVLGDLKLVTGRDYVLEEGMPDNRETCDCIIAGVIGNNTMIDMLAKEKRLDLSDVSGKYETYSFGIIERNESEEHQTLVIAGSDKRGAIYGLFHLSELLGVSPWVYFADVIPATQDSVILTEDVNMVSKEPSVKYRFMEKAIKEKLIWIM